MAKDYYHLILKDFGLQDHEVISVFPFGSRVYGTAEYKSDWDFIVVVNNGVIDKDIRRSSRNQINVNVFTETSFTASLARHRMSSLECIYLPLEQVLKDGKSFPFKFDINLLHKYVIEKSLEDWTSAKKSFECGDMLYIKSIFHATRTLDFAIQIAEYGTIVNYSSCNDLWLELNNNTMFDSWEELRARHAQRYLHLVKDFAEKYILRK
jgi:predicted nucleotidyltransferase